MKCVRYFLNMRLLAFLFILLYMFTFRSLLELFRNDPVVNEKVLPAEDNHIPDVHSTKLRQTNNNNRDTIKLLEEQLQDLSSRNNNLNIKTRKYDSSIWRKEHTPYEFCGSYYANGFTAKIPICDGFTCEHNPTTEATTCVLHDIMIDKEKLKVSKGGEDISQVRNRENRDELPMYSSGVVLVNDENCEVGRVGLDSMQFKYHGKFVKSVTGGKKSQNRECSTVVQKTTLFITRYEYANLYHTYTDLYNLFLAMKVHADENYEGLELDPVQVVFLDGHSKSHMDELWVKLFRTKPTYVSDVPDKTCFKKAVLVAPGYTSPLSIFMMGKKSRKLGQCNLPPGNQFIKNFVQEFKQAFGIKPRSGKPTILLVSRHDYVAHPRSKPKSGTSRKFENEQELLGELANTFESKGYQVKLATFETMTMQQQIQAVSDSSILVGMHGAGLSHVLLKTIDGSESGNRGVVEIVPPSHSSSKHFEYLAQMADALPYLRITCGSANRNNEHYVDPIKLVEAVERLLK